MDEILAKISKETFDTLPEHYQKIYSEKEDGVYIADKIKPVDGWGVENFAALKRALAKERQNASSADELKKRFEDVDLDEVMKIYEQFKDADAWTPSEEVKKQMEARERQIQEKYNENILAKDKEIGILTKEISSRLIDSEVSSCCAKTGLTPGSPELIIPAVYKMTKVVRGEDGKFDTIVLDEDGVTPRITQQPNSNENMKISELMTLLREDPKYKRAFDPVESAGSGDVGNVGAHQKPNLVDPNTSPKQRIADWRRSQAAS
jgi:hypothetical protein